MKTSLSIVALAIGLGAWGAGAAVAAAPAPGGANPADRGLVCHVTGSSTNPIVEIYVPGNANAPAIRCDEGEPGGLEF